MHPKRVTVVSTGRRLRRQLMRALVSGGFEVRAVSFADVRGDDLLRLQPDSQLYVLDADEDIERVKQLLHLLHDRRGDASALVLTREVENQLLVHLLTTEGLSNLVARHTGLSASVDQIDERELIVTANKLVGRDIFGLDKYLSTWGMKVSTQTIASVADKNDAITRLEDYLLEIDCYKAIATSVSMVAEELMMNALFNAPVDAEGRAKYVDVSRSDSLVLEPHETAEFSFACNGHYVGLRVADRFGALQRDDIVDYLRRCFLGARGRLREGERLGAGLGLFMVFNSVTQLVFNIEFGVGTEVIALFYIRGGVRAFRSAGRSLNIFLLQSP